MRCRAGERPLLLTILALPGAVIAETLDAAWGDALASHRQIEAAGAMRDASRQLDERDGNEAIDREREAERRLQSRFAIVNVWRSIAGTVLTSPLACCDAATVQHGDLIAAERRAADRIGELQLVRSNPAHRWYYFPEMGRDEVLLIKTFDSAVDGPARRSIHTAFANPLAPPDAAARESMESRLLVFFRPSA